MPTMDETVAGKPPALYTLSGNEARLFDALSAGGVVAGRDLLHAMWGPGPYADTSGLRSALWRLRDKLRGEYEITYLPGEGYVMRRSPAPGGRGND
jgi:DNA-binding response OmpR family regulator